MSNSCCQGSVDTQSLQKRQRRVLVLVLITFLVSKALVEAHIKSKFHGIKIW